MRGGAPSAKARVAVLGDGGWGTTLAILLYRKGAEVALWGAFPDYVQFLRRRRVNAKFLPGIPIPGGLRITASLEEAVGGRGVIVAAGTSTELVQRFLNWNESSRGAVVLKRICGALVIVAGLYLLWKGA